MGKDLNGADGEHGRAKQKSTNPFCGTCYFQEDWVIAMEVCAEQKTVNNE